MTHKPLPFAMRQNTDMEKWRAETFWDKEPETIAWIDSFERTDTFLDVGANVGVYALYAGHRRIRTVALEPHAANFQSLVLNQRTLNRWMPVVTLFGAAGSRNCMTDFYATRGDAGSSGGACTDISQRLAGTVRMFTVDYLDRIYGPFTHIKIDVDGEEAAIVEGMTETLTRDTLQSCLIEVEPRNKRSITNRFRKAGFTTDSPFNAMRPHSRERRAKEDIRVENIVFVRQRQ